MCLISCPGFCPSGVLRCGMFSLSQSLLLANPHWCLSCCPVDTWSGPCPFLVHFCAICPVLTCLLAQTQWFCVVSVPCIQSVLLCPVLSSVLALCVHSCIQSPWCAALFVLHACVLPWTQLLVLSPHGLIYFPAPVQFNKLVFVLLLSPLSRIMWHSVYEYANKIIKNWTLLIDDWKSTGSVLL